MSDDQNRLYQLNVPSSPMRVAPGHQAECSNECLYGERVIALDISPKHTHNETLSRQTASSEEQQSDWIQVIAQRDSYTGYIQARHLYPVEVASAEATHWVCARSTLVFSAPSIKSSVQSRLPFHCRMTSSGSASSPFRALDSGGFVWEQHLLPIEREIDVTPLELARSHFLGAPYLWGGCTPNGLDCSGLIQALARAHGIDIPRDSGDQENALSNTIAYSARTAQDIVYWPGHTGILVNADTLLHATAHSLNCLIEPLDNVVKRAGPISSIKRLF